MTEAVSMPASAPPASEPAPPAAPSTRLVALLSAAVLALAAGGYALTGSPKLPSAGAPGAAVATAETADPAANAAQFADVVEQLAQKLKEQPNNAEGWAIWRVLTHACNGAATRCRPTPRPWH